MWYIAADRKEIDMAYRYGNRYQMSLLPQSIEVYVAEDDPVRAYDAFVEALDFDELGIDIRSEQS
jgi:transposase